MCMSSDMTKFRIRSLFGDKCVLLLFLLLFVYFVQTLAVDYSKNTEPVVGILYQMISGKSFDLILSAAAATGKLPIFAAEFIKSVMSYHYYSIIHVKKN